MTEWSKVHVWKACVGKPTESSNLSLSAKSTAKAGNRRPDPQGFGLFDSPIASAECEAFH